MNKKIKLMSKTLLFSFLFSVFNPAHSLAMEEEITYVLLNSNQKLEYTKKEKSEGTKTKQFNTAFNECFTNIVNTFNRNHGYDWSYEYDPYKRSVNQKYDSKAKYDLHRFSQKIVLDNKFYNYLFEIMKNIYNIRSLSYDNKPVTLTTLESNTVELFLAFTKFMAQFCWFYCIRTDETFTFKYNFLENNFFKKVTDWINRVQSNKLSDIEEIKNFNEDEKQKFVDYCSNISNNIYNIFMLSIENTCNNKRKLSATVEYSKTLENEVSDIIVQVN